MSKLDLGQRLMRMLPRALGGEAPLAFAEHPDAELLVRVSRAEPAAIEQLYRSHHAALRTYAQRLIGDRDLAEDLVHDVFVSLPRLVSGFRGEGSLRSFLFGVTTRASVRQLTKARRQRALRSRFLEAEPSDVRTPESHYARGQRLATMKRALDRLPFALRTAFVLCELEERSAREASEILAIPEATVRTRCFHARKKLATYLGQEAP